MRNRIVKSLQGVPVEESLIASAQLILEPGVELEAIRRYVEEAIEQKLGGIYEFTGLLTRASWPCGERWK